MARLPFWVDPHLIDRSVPTATWCHQDSSDMNGHGAPVASIPTLLFYSPGAGCSAPRSTRIGIAVDLLAITEMVPHRAGMHPALSRAFLTPGGVTLCIRGVYTGTFWRSLHESQYWARNSGLVVGQLKL